ncbi:MAG TPA: cyclic nucleotide-binding domain-containing protein [Burkholderiaceae bacterium]|nr:cyclic nucleotide-binding domain-containing protein [Burkholderiaceae bacterium]
MTVPAELTAWASSEATSLLAAILASPTRMVATLAAAIGVGLVIAASFVRTMVPLRWLAVGSDAALLVFGSLQPSPITLVLAATLLPINVFRAVEVTRLTRRVARAQADADLTGLWLKPYMKQRKLKAGQTLFSKGEPARWLYLLVDGEMELADIGKPLEAGRIFGEIALFSPSGLRTHTVRCITNCSVLEIHERTVKQLYYQNPAFGFHLIELLAARLSTDVERAEARRSVDDGATGHQIA